MNNFLESEIPSDTSGVVGGHPAPLKAKK
jgi:hypothetical protein